MKKAWKTFWKVIAAFFSVLDNLAAAGEELSEDIRKDVAFNSEKSEARREKKRQKWQAKQP